MNKINKMLQAFVDNGHERLNVKTVILILYYYDMGVVTLDELCREYDSSRNTLLNTMTSLTDRDILENVSVRGQTKFKLTKATRNMLNNSLS